MDMVNKNGQMEQFMKVNGLIIRQKVGENFHTQMETTMKEIGNKTKLMVMESLFIINQELDTRDIGKMTCSMDQELKCIMMGTNMRACLNREREMEKGHTITQLERFIKEVGLMEELRVTEFAHGQMAKNLRDSGKTTKRMDKEYIIGLMADHMKVIIEMIKNMVRALMFGRMGENILDNGRMIKGMDSDYM